MRDAFGGAFMIRLFLVFIFIYMFFTAIALNYAKAFKAKNIVIEYLESKEVYNLGSASATEIEAMEQYFEKEILGGLNYRVSTQCGRVTNKPCEEPGGIGTVYCANGIKIVQVCPNITERNKMGVYYKVETNFTWNLGFLRTLTALSSDRPNGEVSVGIWKISGETRPIVKQK